MLIISIIKTVIEIKNKNKKIRSNKGCYGGEDGCVARKKSGECPLRWYPIIMVHQTVFFFAPPALATGTHHRVNIYLYLCIIQQLLKQLGIFLRGLLCDGILHSMQHICVDFIV